MNHIKQFFKEKGLYLFCLAMVFAATAAGILALRSIVGNVADLTRIRKEALQDGHSRMRPSTSLPRMYQSLPRRRPQPKSPQPPPHPRPHRPRQPTHRPPPDRGSGMPNRRLRSAAMSWSTARRWVTGAPTTAQITLPPPARAYAPPRPARSHP